MFIQYSGADDIPEIETRAQLASRLARNKTMEVDAALAEGRAVHFMPNYVSERDEGWNETRRYRLHLMGCLENGTKAHVVVEGIMPFFDVRVPAGETAEGLRARLLDLLDDQEAKPASAEVVEGFPLFGFVERKVEFLRLHYREIGRRRAAVNVVRGQGLDTASDDVRGNYYHRKFARETGVSLADWMVLERYVLKYGGGRESPLSQYLIEVRPGGFRSLVDPTASFEIQDEMAKTRTANPFLANDRLLVLAWDIETYSSDELGDLPLGTDEHSRMFMLCCSLHWKDCAEPLRTFCLTDLDWQAQLAGGAAPGRPTTVVCRGEADIITAFAVLLRKFAPDFVVGFNDGGYDWPFVLEKAYSYRNGTLKFLVENSSALPTRVRAEETIYADKYCLVRDRHIKVTADTSVAVAYLNMPGAICVDARIQLMQAVGVTPKSSLNFYLAMHELPLKKDMPYTQMFSIYRRACAGDAAALAQMEQVAEYCVEDALSCQRLMVKRSVLNDNREVSFISSVTMYDSIYFANAVKVCNMVHEHATRRGTLCSSIVNEVAETEKYPGAWVFEPVKGLHRDRPLVGLDFASLYPSVIMAMNFSPEKAVASAEQAEALRAKGFTVNKVSFEYGGRQVDHWFVWHGNDDRAMGVYPSILHDLFNRRVAVKDGFNKLKAQLEHMESLGVDGMTDETVRRCGDELRRLEPAPNSEGIHRTKSALYLEYLDAVDGEARRSGASLADVFRRTYSEMCVQKSMLDSKQKAIKVFMNTFYGVAGNIRSPLFMRELAAGVTTVGQYNIKLVDAFIRRNGYRVLYGDTDSVYVMCPEEAYAGCDGRHAAGSSREEYWSEMVLVTMKEVAVMRDKVNEMLKADNGTSFLKVAYEEVLFPTVLTGKKKYFGIPHVDIPNFHPPKLFIRGIDVVKRNQCKFVKTIGMRVMWEAMSVDNDLDMLGVVEKVLTDVLRDVDALDVSEFVSLASFRPNKKNVAVQTFVRRQGEIYAAELAENERRRERGDELVAPRHKPPEPGEKFEYVICEKPKFDKTGKMSHLSKGERMEYADVVRDSAGALRIDVHDYLISYVVGLCARFVSFDTKFASGLGDEADVKNAKRYIKDVVNGLWGVGTKEMRSHGNELRKNYRHAKALSAYRFAAHAPLAFSLARDSRADFTAPVEEVLNRLEAGVDVRVRELSTCTFTGVFRALGVDKTDPIGIIAALDSISPIAVRSRRDPSRQSRTLIRTLLRSFDRKITSCRERMASAARRVADSIRRIAEKIELAVAAEPDVLSIGKHDEDAGDGLAHIDVDVGLVAEVNEIWMSWCAAKLCLEDHRLLQGTMRNAYDKSMNHRSVMSSDRIADMASHGSDMLDSMDSSTSSLDMYMP